MNYIKYFNKKTLYIPLVAFFLLSCSSSNKSIIPVDNKQDFEDTYTIIWNGYSKVYIYKNNTWNRIENFDYYFDVIQKRYDKVWKSVKSLHRTHPNYKGSNRNQTMYFEVKYNSIENNIVNGTIESSLGKGKLKTDIEFRDTKIEISLNDANIFMPYNKMIIDQKYDYENGKLTETVLLVKEKDGKQTPFMKNEEVAYFYIKGKLDKAPTKFTN